MGSAATSIDENLFCARCGEAYAPKKPVCVGCGSAPARHWLHLTALSTLGLLTFVLVTAVAPIIPWWIPAGQPPDSFLAKISRYPGLPSSLAWLTVTLVLILLCWNPNTRDSLLGHGRVLSIISIVTLLVLLS